MNPNLAAALNRLAAKAGHRPVEQILKFAARPRPMLAWWRDRED